MRTDEEKTETEKAETEKPEKERLGTRSEMESVGACKRRIKAAIPVDKVNGELERNYRELGKMVQLPGFRRGRVPRKLLEARFGEEVVSDVKEGLVSTSFAEVVEEKQLRMVGAPRFDNIQFEKDADLQYEVEFEVRPEFQLADYKGIEVTREALPVTDDHVEEQLKIFQRRAASWTLIDALEGGPDDYFRGTYNLYREGIKVKALEKVSFRPSSKVLDVFAIADLPARIAAWDRSTQSPIRFEVKVPSYYPDELLRGAEAQLEFLLDDVARMELPPLDDEFAKKLGKETLAELRADVRESLIARHHREEEKRVEEKILDKIADATPMDLPEGLMDSQAEKMRLQREYGLLEQGLAPEQAQEQLAAEREGITEDLRREVKRAFLLSEIADKEKVFVTEEEVDERVSLLARYYEAPVSRMREELRSTNRLEEMRVSLLHEKTRAFLRENARVLETAGEEGGGEGGGSKNEDKKNGDEQSGEEEAGRTEAGGDAQVVSEIPEGT